MFKLNKVIPKAQFDKPEFLHNDNYSIEEIANEWNVNALARNQELESGIDKTYFEIILPHIKSYLNQFLKIGDRIIDIGCGLGYLTKSISIWGYDVAGIDIAEKAIDYACKKFPEIPFDWMSIIKFSKSNSEPFDACVANMVLHNTIDLKSNLMAIKRLVKPNGIVIATIPDPMEWFPTRKYAQDQNFEYNECRVFKIPFKIRNGDFHPSPVTHVHRPLSLYKEEIEMFGFEIILSENPLDSIGLIVEDMLFCVWRR